MHFRIIRLYNDGLVYYDYRLNVPLFEEICGNGLEEPTIPLGGFTDCNCYGGLTWEKEDANDIMRFILLKCFGINRIKKVHELLQYSQYINNSASHINRVIRIWNLIRSDVSFFSN